MSTVITRSALLAWGRTPAPDLAFVVSDYRREYRVVTWAEVMDSRRERQRKRLSLIRRVECWRAYKLWVAYFDQWCMGGWQAMVEDWRGRDHSVWIDRDRRWMRPALMDLFPVALRLGSEEQQWELWKQQFASQYQRRSHDHRPLGVAYFWWDGHSEPRVADATAIGRRAA